MGVWQTAKRIHNEKRMHEINMLLYRRRNAEEDRGQANFEISEINRRLHDLGYDEDEFNAWVLMPNASVSGAEPQAERQTRRDS